MTELPPSTRLPHESPGRLHLPADPLFVGDLRPADVRLHLEFPEEAIDEDFEVQFPHAGHDRLTGLFIDAHPEGRILLAELGQSDVQLLLIGAGLRFDGHVHDRFGEFDLLENDRIGFIAQRVAGRRPLESDDGDDIAGVDVLAFGPVVGVHLEQARDPFPPFGRSTENIRTGRPVAGYDPHQT